jgi:hypothetical protein
MDLKLRVVGKYLDPQPPLRSASPASEGGDNNEQKATPVPNDSVGMKRFICVFDTIYSATADIVVY